mmetsp:Transcript_35802/g.89081  ORF Transcript_35802/g.89081 Transcript_35802/m.89081 type:complete len:217 (+) Transcript_35802:1303-1953(+)
MHGYSIRVGLAQQDRGDTEIGTSYKAFRNPRRTSERPHRSRWGNRSRHRKPHTEGLLRLIQEQGLPHNCQLLARCQYLRAIYSHGTQIRHHIGVECNPSRHCHPHSLLPHHISYPNECISLQVSCLEPHNQIGNDCKRNAHTRRRTHQHFRRLRPHNRSGHHKPSRLGRVPPTCGFSRHPPSQIPVKPHSRNSRSHTCLAGLSKAQDASRLAPVQA